jgi:hypothetical protein
LSNFKAFLNHELKQLREHLGVDARVTYTDVADAAGLTRASLYNWMSGTPATDAALKKLVTGLATLGGTSGYRAPTVKEVAESIVAPDPRQSGRPVLAFMNYGPFVQLEAGNWSFLGQLLRHFARISRACEAPPDGAAGFDLIDIEEPGDDDNKALVGAFLMPHRAQQWISFKLPLQMGLNAVVLRRDLTAFADIRAARFAGAESLPIRGHLDTLAQELWYPGHQPASGWIDDLNFITASGEAGYSFLRDMHAVPDAPHPQSDDSAPASYHQRLWQASEAFHASKKRGVGDGARLPIIVADELSCLKILQIHRESTVSARSDAILLSGASDPKATLSGMRPCFPLAVAFRRGLLGSGQHSHLFDVIQEEFREFILSFRGIIARDYVRLHHELHRAFGEIKEVDVTRLVINWLSLEGALRRASGCPASIAPLTDVPNIEHWRAILDAAAQEILNSEFGPLVRTALGLAPAAPAASAQDV